MAIKKTEGNKLEKAHLVYYFVLAIAIVILVKIILIQYRDGDALRKKASTRSIVESVIIADRGNIYSHDGELIATSIPRFDIYVDFSVKNVDKVDFDAHYDSLAICLGRYFPEKTYDKWKKQLEEYRKEQNTYGSIVKNIDYNQLKIVRSFPLFRMGRFKGGIIEEKRDKRVFPFGILAQRTIGFSRDGIKVGIEGAYDIQLAGKNGKRMKQRLPGNRYVPLDDDFIIKPQQGLDVITTIDMRVQDVAENALLEHLIKHDAQWGCAVLMEVETGEIRAIANLEKVADGNYYEVYNHAIGTLYEPGSSFKLFSMLTMLEDGNLNLDEIVHTGNGSLRVGKWEVFDSHALGDITAREVFEYSSNVGTIMLMLKRYKDNPEKFIDRLYAMGLHKPMGIDIRGEQAANIPYPYTSNWSSSSLPSISYGYGLTITPLQLLAYYNAVANNGVLVRPMFVKEFRIAGKTVTEFSPVILKDRICSKETAVKLQSMMEGVVDHGTAKNLKNAACRIAGKTATARIWDNDAKQYSDKNYNATFVGYFPADNPTYSCIVVVNKPSMGLIYGSNVSAPVFRDIAEIVYATELDIHDPVNRQIFIGVKGLPKMRKIKRSIVKTFISLMPVELQSVKIPEYDWITLSGDSVPSFQPVIFEKDIMPDLTGMNLRDAVELIEQSGCKIKATGKGRVAHQSVAPGTTLKKGITIVLTLK
jgi:cell division protein FtsI (penicillin-binding protein 3)